MDTQQKNTAANTNTQKRIHAFTDDVLADLDAVAIAEKIRKKDISPQEVMQATMQRAQRVNPYINAICHDSFPQDGKKICFSKKGPFAGLPFFIKDNTEVKGFPTAFGATLDKPIVAKKHSVITQQFLDQGFVVVGKSSLPEFGLNASTEFVHSEPTRNPWHLDYSTGASSGGAAALVAAGVTPIAHANDGGGSIRIPAACCGLVGLKPTRGRFLDSLMIRMLPINIISEGVVTRSVRDTAHFYAGLANSHKAKNLPAIGLVEGANKRRLRIGLVLDSVSTNSDEETRHAVLESAALLHSLGHEIVEFELPFSTQFVEDFTLYWGFLASLMSGMGQFTLQKNNKTTFDALTQGLSHTFKSNALKSIPTLRRLKQIQAQYMQMFEQVDVLISPVLAHTTPKIGYLSPALEFDELFARLQRYVTFTPIQNIAGAPSLSLPLGRAKNGLPIGVLFSANLGDERTLLELAYELEEAQGWQHIHQVK